jgi:hypothetical protein
MKETQIAKFEYEIMDNVLNLYDRTDTKNGLNVLRFQS